MTKIIGLTGPTGSGKTIISDTAKEQNIKVVDCDIVARKAVEKGTRGLEALIGVFSADILNPDGTLNRKALAKKAFSSAENTELLNKTLFPFITELVKKEIEGSAVLLDAPTLFESGLDSICTAVIAVLADKELRLRRIMERDKISENDALLRMNAGKPDKFYKEKTPYIVYNNGDMAKYKNE